MSMVSILSMLPPELLDGVFSLLANDKQAIGNCRLTCRTFKEQSSPYLITKVVFAKRLKAIARLQDVMEHSYFHKHVTELVYDASWFDGGPAESWTEYVEACRRAPQNLKDSEWPARLRDDDSAFRSIRGKTTTRPATQYQRSFEMDDGALGWSDDEEDMRAYCLGCHKSFPNYKMFSRAEERIQYDNLARQVIVDAFTKLPKLKSVLITDWRGLVKAGESYSECACRVFGNTLAPEHMDANRGEYSCFYEVASAALDVPGARITSFAIGPHPFEHGDVHDRDNSQDARDAHYLPTDLLKLFGKLATQSLFSGLRQLRLALEFPDSAIRSGSADALSMREILAKCSDLTHLTLCSQRPLQIDSSVSEKSTSQLIALLTDWHFRHLRFLDLRQWILPEEYFKEVLGRHSATLRKLRLLRCLLFHGNAKDLAEWAGSNLYLEGIELDGYQALTPVLQQDSRVRESILNPLTEEWEQFWLSGRKNNIKREPAPMLLNNSDGTPWYSKQTELERGPWP